MDGFMKRVSMVQCKLKAPKGQTNNFGKYNYRSCEDILEAVKPLLLEQGLVLTVGDEMVQIGDRFYIKATASLLDVEGDGSIQNVAFAREPAEKKGMDASQVTGATSSYARKYALNGLLCIDDTKDADTPEYGQNGEPTKKEGTPPAPPDCPPPPPPLDEDLPILCADCGEVIRPAKKKDGTRWLVPDIVKYCDRVFGRPLCDKCISKAVRRANDGAAG